MGGWMGGWVDGWMGGWMGGWVDTGNSHTLSLGELGGLDPEVPGLDFS